jgi:hypothetical protein
MTDATGAEGTYKVHAVDTSSTADLAEAYARAATDGEITASVWDGHRVNIITRTGASRNTGKTFRAISAKSGTPEELEQSLAQASAGGGRVVSAVWDGKNVNLIVEG